MELGNYTENRRRAAEATAQRQMEGQDQSRLGELAQRAQDEASLRLALEEAHPEMTQDPERMRRMLAGVDPTSMSDEPDTEAEPVTGGIRAQTGAQ